MNIFISVLFDFIMGSKCMCDEEIQCYNFLWRPGVKQLLKAMVTNKELQVSAAITAKRSRVKYSEAHLLGLRNSNLFTGKATTSSKLKVWGFDSPSCHYSFLVNIPFWVQFCMFTFLNIDDVKVAVMHSTLKGKKRNNKRPLSKDFNAFFSKMKSLEQDTCHWFHYH